MRTFFYAIILIVFCSCIKELEYTVKHTPKILVINGILEANHEISIHVSGLQSVLDTSLRLINKAIVILEENNVIIDTMRSKGQGYYHSKKTALPLNEYTLRVCAEGYQTAFATVTIPLQSQIARAKRFLSNTFDEDGIQNTDYVIEIRNIPLHKSYFDFFIAEEIMDSDTYCLAFVSELFISDPVFDETGIDYEMFPFSFLFDNQSINRQDYILNFTTRNIKTVGSRNYNKSIFFNAVNGDVAVLRTVSKSYSDYRLSWNKHKMSQNDSLKIENLLLLPLLGEPSEMYSNIENGLGVLIAYNQHYLKIE